MEANTNEDLALQLQRYQRLLESTQAVPWEASLPDWRFTYIGPQIVDILGYTVEQWQEPDFWVQHLHPEDREWAMQYCQDSVSRLEDHEFEYRMIANDGRVVWFRDIVNVIHEDNKTVTLHGFMFDVTERKQIEQVMRTMASTGSSLDINEFYKICVKNLAMVYNSKYAFIGLLQESNQDVRTVAVWSGKDYAENFEYNLDGTPCKEILNREKELIPKDASLLYRDDELLVNMQIHSYFGAPLITSDGKTIGLVSVMDINPMVLTTLTSPILSIFATRIAIETERQIAINSLTYSQNALTQAQHIAHIGSFEYDRKKDKFFWSNEALSILNWTEKNQTTNDLSHYCELIDNKDREDFLILLDELFNNKEFIEHEHRLLLDGKNRHIEFRAHHYFDNIKQRNILIGTIHDVTERYEYEQELQKMANFDSLTGLPNRWMLNQKLHDAIEAAKSSGISFCLALLDLDGFKEVNDTLGHFAGDKLLRQTKPRFENLLREHDYIARLGGDEFAIIFYPISQVSEAEQLVNCVHASFTEPFELEKSKIQVGASIGISVYPDHGKESSELLRHADVAMYQAKELHSGHSVYDAERDPYGPRRLALINDIRGAIEDEQLLVYYQPKIDTVTGLVKGVEALVRWQHPVHGFIPPNEFIPFCEVSDVIHDLTDYVVVKSLNDTLAWNKAGLDIKVSVNIAARNLMNHSLSEQIQAALTKTSASASILQLEITENDLMHDPERAKTTVKKLSEMGVGLTIDDFGTGYSSLSYLKHLRVQELKIDQSFVIDMLKDENDAVIVRSIIDLAHSLGLQVTSEGVESANILKQLLSYGCEHAQGFHIARPMPATELTSWLKSFNYQKLFEKT
ncbi:EAL domain-containing protein [Thiohalophilus thiocyanatoxydans]|uniref:PAS domain S-box-containing protein/diguanylate cyclase (GGDEF)-like protein n=1 Tax=Thiohalophilus thiocyanatoxydans TaxID=381308 RepID=A0A4R8IKJ8_9GAMM|nr:EAL domain-containing protein [Thiohalophilus thiocyanatoxydans]TDX99549.1 PAS domain S-box-containing protein/diguanylate cyclase (GGDEF)-like protein [Thiohalophilus thiocyanatoxydans]